MCWKKWRRLFYVGEKYIISVLEVWQRFGKGSLGGESEMFSQDD
jgi:hypothetical protein